MELSVWSSYYVDLSPEDAVRELKRNGIWASELSDEHGEMLLQRGEPEEAGRAFKAFLDAEHFAMPQGHLWLRVRLGEDGALPVLKRWCDLYEAIGIENAVLHCDSFRENTELSNQERLDRNLALLLELQSMMQGMRIRICLENLRGIVTCVEDLLWLVERLDPDRFGICLDTGHLNLTAKDQAHFIRAAGKRLRALHIADNQGETDQHMMPFGRGTVDFEEVMHALREVGYEGLFNLEIPGERLAPMEVRGYKLHYIRHCYEYLMRI